jgi:WD40 repeat protein
MPDESSLSFWSVSPNGSISLQTRIQQPHTRGITSLAFDRNHYVAATSSMDGKFKIWEFLKDENSDKVLLPIPFLFFQI